MCCLAANETGALPTLARRCRAAVVLMLRSRAG